MAQRSPGRCRTRRSPERPGGAAPTRRASARRARGPAITSVLRLRPVLGVPIVDDRRRDTGHHRASRPSGYDGCHRKASGGVSHHGRGCVGDTLIVSAGTIPTPWSWLGAALRRLARSRAAMAPNPVPLQPRGTLSPCTSITSLRVGMSPSLPRASTKARIADPYAPSVGAEAGRSTMSCGVVSCPEVCGQ